MSSDPQKELTFDLSGIGLRLMGLPERLLARTAELWSPFLVPSCPDPFLEARLEWADPLAATPEGFDPKAMRSDLHDGRAVYSTEEGTAEVSAEGTATVRIHQGLSQGVEFYAFTNFVRACLAWHLPSRGAALVHAAALVIGDRGFLLVGPEGSGKTTWASVGQRCGARVVSDDLVLVDARAAELLGAPFRSTLDFDAERGRWPLAAILLPAHDEDIGLFPVPALSAHARLVANLPFIAEGLGRDPRVSAFVETLLSAVPCRGLRFARDARFVDLLRDERSP